MTKALGQGHYSVTLPELALFLFIYGLPAAAIGWLLQALAIVCLRVKGDDRPVTLLVVPHVPTDGRIISIASRHECLASMHGRAHH